MATHDTDSTPFQSITDLDRVIHEPSRLAILAVLSIVESADFLFLLHQTGLTRGNLSSHLSKLEAAGYVNIEKEFVDKTPRTLLRLTDAGHQALQHYRQDMLHVLQNLET